MHMNMLSMQLNVFFPINTSFDNISIDESKLFMNSSIFALQMVESYQLVRCEICQRIKLGWYQSVIDLFNQHSHGDSFFSSFIQHVANFVSFKPSEYFYELQTIGQMYPFLAKFDEFELYKETVLDHLWEINNLTLQSQVFGKIQCDIACVNQIKYSKMHKYLAGKLNSTKHNSFILNQHNLWYYSQMYKLSTGIAAINDKRRSIKDIGSGNPSVPSSMTVTTMKGLRESIWYEPPRAKDDRNYKNSDQAANLDQEAIQARLPQFFEMIPPTDDLEEPDEMGHSMNSDLTENFATAMPEMQNIHEMNHAMLYEAHSELGGTVNSDQPANNTTKIYNLLQLINECQHKSVLLPKMKEKVDECTFLALTIYDSCQDIDGINAHEYVVNAIKCIMSNHQFYCSKFTSLTFIEDYNYVNDRKLRQLTNVLREKVSEDVFYPYLNEVMNDNQFANIVNNNTDSQIDTYLQTTLAKLIVLALEEYKDIEMIKKITAVFEPKINVCASVEWDSEMMPFMDVLVSHECMYLIKYFQQRFKHQIDDC